VGSRRADLVIVGAEPADVGWLLEVSWASLIAPSGLLAVLTHARSRDGWLVDPIADITAMAYDNQLAPVDRIVLLEVPLHEIAAGWQSSDSGPTGLSSLRRVSSELLLYAFAGRDLAGSAA